MSYSRLRTRPKRKAKEECGTGKTRKSNEGAVLLAVRTALSNLGYVVFRVQSGTVRVKSYGRSYVMRLAPTGTPDLAGYCPKSGKGIFIEVKDKAKVTPEQQEFLDKAKAAGCLAGVARSVEDALAIVRGETK